MVHLQGQGTNTLGEGQDPSLGHLFLTLDQHVVKGRKCKGDSGTGGRGREGEEGDVQIAVEASRVYIE